MIGRVQIDLRLSESQRGPARAEGHRPHAQHPLIKAGGGRHVRNGQYTVVKPLHPHFAFPPATGAHFQAGVN